MKSDFSTDKYDLTRIVVKPLYFGLGVNVIIPGALLLVCYFFNQRGDIGNMVGTWANSLFYIFCGLAVVLAGIAIIPAKKKLKQPLIRRRETFEQDIITGLREISLPMFLMIAGISLLGIVYFFLTGRFRETVFFVVASFIVFQVVRPRYGIVRKLISTQEDFVDKEHFRTQ
ncbi:MAG: hypothetical protein U9N55_08565 [candidate division Zixibacteria bacterium]|nr:hypothetical protein [candidate division Zixibacteria bacterium]